mgnify:CR=1 FL=1
MCLLFRFYFKAEDGIRDYDVTGVQTCALPIFDENPDIWKEMHQKTGRSTVPQIYINDQYIGGYDDLSAADRSGELSMIING